MMIELHNVRKSYRTAKRSIEVLKGESYIFKEGGINIIKGPSGCGKTTLLKILGLLERPDEGEYYFDGTKIDFRSSGNLAKLRNEKIGCIMQDYKLIPHMTVYENIIVPMLINKNKSGGKVEELVRYLGLEDILGQSVDHISGGERQRTAIARALIMLPSLILADEPTSALDRKNTEEIMKLFIDIHERYGSTIIIATHDERIAVDSACTFLF